MLDGEHEKRNATRSRSNEGEEKDSRTIEIRINTLQPLLRCGVDVPHTRQSLTKTV